MIKIFKNNENDKQENLIEKENKNMKENEIKNKKLNKHLIRGLTIASFSGVLLANYIVPSFAADDPLSVINNLSNFIFGLIRTVGMIILGFGVVQVGMSLPQQIIDAINNCGFFESIPLWAVTLLGGLFVTVLSFILILTVYGRFFKLYMYTAIAPIPLSSFAGEPTQNIGRSFLKSYIAVCLEGAIIVLACVIFSSFAASPPQVDTGAEAVTMVWKYVSELIFNMLVLVGTIRLSDRIVREMMGL